jgi:2-oxoglutarate dehydrogenase E1 component
MSASLSFRSNLDLLDSQYELWLKNPAAVESHWAAFFEGFELGSAKLLKEGSAFSSGEQTAGTLSEATLNFRWRVTNAILTYRTLGHTAAWMDPLAKQAPVSAAITLEALGFSEADLQQEVQTHLFRSGDKKKLKDLIDDLHNVYCHRTGYEFMHIHNPEVRQWLQDRIENRVFEPKPTFQQRVDNLRWLLEAETFERFLHRRYVGQKRFSVEGGESLLVALENVKEHLPLFGGKEIVLGMAHRGRLSVLANFMRKPLSMLFNEFSENYVPNMVAGDGDVKYHLGFETTRKNRQGSEVGIILAANPSHLEAVNPVVEGMARARQRHIDDYSERKAVIPVLVHGDAAFAGQGVVAEVLNLSQLPGYRTGGTIHIVVNNQIGFTTQPADARSSQYCTDVAKMIEAPVFHVNGDCPDEVAWAAKTAVEFRQKFHRDVVIDIVCYRRYGHNETDEPAFTQPNMARAITEHASTAALYRQELLRDGVLDEAAAEALEVELNQALESGQQALEKAVVIEPVQGMIPFEFTPTQTAVPKKQLLKVATKLLETPKGFSLHPTIAKRFLAARQRALDVGKGIDWAFAESMAFGTLLVEKHGVRLSGQDCRRGTFSQRHAVFYDTETRERHIPLQNLTGDQGRFCVYNSLLSEAAVLGFDYGYSLLASNILICWEAQFGDFANGAQVIIDQFICSAESKWGRASNITMLLPHGYEGQGPEHSSARMERFLQLSAEGNWQVCNLSTPAQYFHALRRQVKRSYAKPLILMTPKSLLRHPKCVSSITDLVEGTSFQEIIDDGMDVAAAQEVVKVILCSGKVYYDLLEMKEAHQINNVAIVRIEQVYPLHIERLAEILNRYPKARGNVTWCQEEPGNMGAHDHLRPQLEALLGHSVKYAGRERSASTAVGAKAIHLVDQDRLLRAAFTN